MKETTPRNPRYLRFVRGFASCLAWPAPKSPPTDAWSTLVPWPPRGADGDLEDFWHEPTVAHHVRLGGGGGVGLKPSDYRTVPLTDSEHRALHQTGEASFWRARGVDPDRVIIALLEAFLRGEGVDLADLVWRAGPACARHWLEALEREAGRREGWNSAKGSTR